MVFHIRYLYNTGHNHPPKPTNLLILSAYHTSVLRLSKSSEYSMNTKSKCTTVPMWKPSTRFLLIKTYITNCNLKASVYCIGCGYDLVYIGKTGRNLKTREKQHKDCCLNAKLVKSTLAQAYVEVGAPKQVGRICTPRSSQKLFRKINYAINRSIKTSNNSSGQQTTQWNVVDTIPFMQILFFTSFRFFRFLLLYSGN